MGFWVTNPKLIKYFWLNNFTTEIKEKTLLFSHFPYRVVVNSFICICGDDEKSLSCILQFVSWLLNTTMLNSRNDEDYLYTKTKKKLFATTKCTAPGIRHRHARDFYLVHWTLLLPWAFNAGWRGEDREKATRNHIVNSEANSGISGSFFLRLLLPSHCCSLFEDWTTRSAPWDKAATRLE